MQTLSQYDLNQLKPMRGRGNRVGGPFGAVQSFAKGALLAFVAAVAVNARQTITTTGTPTSGAGTFAFNGQRFVLPFNATAAVAAAILQALPNVGAGNVAVTGGALPGTPLVIEFVNSLAGLELPTIVLVSHTYGGGATPTSAVATTQKGVSGGRWVIRDATVLAPPAAPTVAGNGAGSAFGAGTYAVQATYLTAAGESTPSAPTLVTATANQNLRVSAIAAPPSGATAARYYVNGLFAAETPVAGGAVAQTDLAGLSATARQTPRTNGAFPNGDGRHVAAAVAPIAFSTDEFGSVIRGASGQTQFGMAAPDQWLYSDGLFRSDELAGLDQLAVDQLRARFVRGGLGLAGSEILIPAYLTD